MKIKRYHAVLLVVLFIIVGNIIYLDHKLDDSPVPGGWGVSIDWGRYYIVQKEHIYEKGETALTWQSNTKDYGAVDILPKVYFATLNIITGTTTFPNDLKLHYFFPWIGTFFLPLLGLFWYSYISRREKRVARVDYCLLFLFSMFPIASAIGPVSGNTNGSGVTRALFILILILILINSNKKYINKKRVGILVFLFFPFFYYYHTWSYYLLIFFSVIVILAAVKKETRHITGIAISGIIIFFIVSLSFNAQLQVEPERIINYFFADTTPPDTTITSGPSGTINYNNITFEWTGNDDKTSTSNLLYSYKLEGYDNSWSSWVPLTNKSYNNLPDNSYTFKVKAKDRAGNVDATPTEVTFTVRTGAAQNLNDFLGYKSLGSAYSYLQFINAALILLICLIFLWRYITQGIKKRRETYENMLFYFLIAQFPIAAGLFVWENLLGIYARIFEQLIYITILISAYLLVKTKGKTKTFIRSIILIITILCIVSFLATPNKLDKSVTTNEFIGVSFAGEEIPKTSYIFSDFRLGMPLMYFGQLGIKTVDNPHSPPKTTEEILTRCYYNVSDPELVLDKFIGSQNYYVVISSHQSRVCILDPSLTPFKPAHEDFQEKWSKQQAFNKIYTSDYIDTFQRFEGS